MSENKIFWAPSDDVEMWHYSDVSELLESEEYPNHAVGDIITLYYGECNIPLASLLVPNMEECMTEQAYEHGGEVSETWRPCFKQFQKEVEELANKHFPNLDFGEMHNIKSEKLKITEMDDGHVKDFDQVEE